MAASSISSSSHCCSSSFAYSYISFIGFHHDPKNFLLPWTFPKILGSIIASLQSKRDPFYHMILMQDGTLAAAVAGTENEAPPKDLKEGLLVTPQDEHRKLIDLDANDDKWTVSITVVGASGDLAKKKIFPALFALYYEDCLPEHFTIFGYARSKMTDAELRNMVSKALTCRIDKRENCGEKMEQFLKRCFYHSGQYDSQENFMELDKKLREHEAGWVSNQLFDLSIPPNIFVDAVKCASLSASASAGWTRVIVEKPFGRDSESSAALTKALKKYLDEEQIFSYFDHYGIIRDIMQNHLLQILALFAMETPITLDAEDIRNEKVKVLRSMRPLRVDDAVIGQYKSHSKGGVMYPGYTDDKTVPKDCLTPTFAATALFIDNARWDGVPFLLKSGKALHNKRYSKEIPDAYERLLLDAIEGERRLFIRCDELDSAWALFSPVLKELEEKNLQRCPLPCSQIQC